MEPAEEVVEEVADTAEAVVDEVVETTDPQTSAWRRFTAWFLKIAPENQL